MKKKIVISVVTVVLLLALIYVGLSVYFNNHFYLGTTINGVDVSLKSTEAAYTTITDSLADYSLSLIDLSGDAVDIIDSKEAGIKPSGKTESIQKIINNQNGFMWPVSLASKNEYFLEDLVEVDEKILSKTVEGLKCIKESGKVANVNATCEFVDGKFEIVDAVYGNTIDKKGFVKHIASDIEGMKSEVNLLDELYFETPEYTKDSKEVINLCDELNKVIETPVVYDLGEFKDKVSAETIADWIIIKEDLSYELDDEKLKGFVAEMANKYNTYGKDKKLMTSYGVEVTVKGKNYGWKIDEEAEVNQLKEDLSSGNGVKRDFIYSSKANSHGENDYGNTYVEINLTAQHLYMYVDGQLIVETDFVSGNPKKGNATPVGACQVTYTTKNATLRGPGYASFVHYWMPFNGNVGMHDATWRNKFGGSIYNGNGSHGCINLPLSAAQTIYENLHKGDCVLVYSLGGTENTEVTDEKPPVKPAQSDVPEVTTPENNTEEFDYYTWLLMQLSQG